MAWEENAKAVPDHPFVLEPLRLEAAGHFDGTPVGEIECIVVPDGQVGTRTRQPRAAEINGSVERGPSQVERATLRFSVVHWQPSAAGQENRQANDEQPLSHGFSLWKETEEHSRAAKGQSAGTQCLGVSTGSAGRLRGR